MKHSNFGPNEEVCDVVGLYGLLLMPAAPGYECRCDAKNKSRQRWAVMVRFMESLLMASPVMGSETATSPPITDGACLRQEPGC